MKRKACAVDPELTPSAPLDVVPTPPTSANPAPSDAEAAALDVLLAPHSESDAEMPPPADMDLPVPRQETQLACPASTGLVNPSERLDWLTKRDKPVPPPSKPPTVARRPASPNEQEPGGVRRAMTSARFGAAAASLLLLGVAVTLGTAWVRGKPRVPLAPARGRACSNTAHSLRPVLFDPTWIKEPTFPRRHAKVQPDGTFVVGTYADDDGPGDYRVMMTWFPAQKPKDMDGLPRSMLPRRYGGFTTSGLTAHDFGREKISSRRLSCTGERNSGPGHAWWTLRQRCRTTMRRSMMARTRRTDTSAFERKRWMA